MEAFLPSFFGEKLEYPEKNQLSDLVTTTISLVDAVDQTRAVMVSGQSINI